MSSSMQTKSRLASLMTVSMTLHDVLYISYAVPAKYLRAALPEFIRLATLDEDKAFLSIVVLQCKKVRLNSLPFVRFAYNQLNLRTYIIDPITGDNGVYFLQSGVTSHFISLATRMVGIPWQRINLDVQVRPGGNNLLFYNAVGYWQGNCKVTAIERTAPSRKPALFADMKSAVDYLVRPLIGFYRDREHVGRFSIWHQDIMPQVWQLQQVDIPVLCESGIVEDVAEPHSVFFLDHADFSINMPPTFLKR
jgi:uncharacterized protein YqjF (DUF2071 family)